MPFSLLSSAEVGWWICSHLSSLLITWSPHVPYWGKSSNFLSFKLSNSQGFMWLNGHSCFSLPALDPAPLLPSAVPLLFLTPRGVTVEDWSCAGVGTGLRPASSCDALACRAWVLQFVVRREWAHRLTVQLGWASSVPRLLRTPSLHFPQQEQVVGPEPLLPASSLKGEAVFSSLFFPSTKVLVFSGQWGRWI